MKKFLIFMLVLCLATVANAALTGIQLSLNGATNGNNNTQEITVPVSTELTIDVHGIAINWLGYVIINGDPPANGEWGDALAPGAVPGYYVKSGYPMILPAAGDMSSATRYAFAGWGWGYEITAAASPGHVVIAGEQFDLMFHCRNAPGDATITLWDASDYDTPQDTIIVHQIPEPMTIMLLGLGGLLLRRRK